TPSGRTMASPCACPRVSKTGRSTSCSSQMPTAPKTWWCASSVAQHCSPPVSAKVPRAPCCCRAAAVTSRDRSRPGRFHGIEEARGLFLVELLRFSTMGSVDDGKSTLIGRLLYESNGIYQDQFKGLQRAGAPDFSLVTDGLRAEREQG